MLHFAGQLANQVLNMQAPPMMPDRQCKMNISIVRFGCSASIGLADGADTGRRERERERERRSAQ